MELEVVRHLARSALRNLEAHRRRIDDLNVYPVPDGDTGTNLTLTMRGIVDELERSTAATTEQLAADLQRAATMEAKGNSGVILSTIVRGMTRVLGEQETVDGEILARALRAGSTSAYQAVKVPVAATERSPPTQRGTTSSAARARSELATSVSARLNTP